MLRKLNKIWAQRGSLMVEAIAMLGLISMVTPIIYKKAAERTNEMQDINAASQIRTIVNSIDDYLRDNYVTITSGGTVTSNSATSDKSINYGDFDFGAMDNDTTAKTTTPINIEHFRDYLPLGFKSTGRIFNDFKVVIKQTRDPSGERKALTTVMVAKPNDKNPELSRLRSARIASMIGTNGGFLDGNKATGVQGVWEIDKADLPDSNNLKDGSIVATSIEAVADGTGGGKNVLHRVEVPGRPEYNTMETALSMGGNNINQIVNLIAAADTNNNTINIKAANGDDSAILHVDGESIIDSTLKAAGENFVVESGYAQHKQSLYVGSGTSAGSAQFMVDGNTGSMSALRGKFSVDSNGATPYVKLTGNNGKTAFNANESLISFMEQNVMISPEGNTDISGYAHIEGDLRAANGQFTANSSEAHFYNETLNVLNSGQVNVGSSTKQASLRVYGDAQIDDLTVENTFKAGNINNSGKYGLTVDQTSGDTTLNAKLVANDSAGNKIFDVGDTMAGATVAKQFIAGSYDGTRGGIGLAADESGATVRFKDTNSSFVVNDINNSNQIEAKQGYTKFAINNEQILNLYETPSLKPQAQFSSDISFYDGTQNILTISNENLDGSTIDGGRGSIHIRKGVIELDRNTNSTDNQTNPISYIKADRFISNVSDSNADKTNTLDSAITYDFEINPAYTSMMNDIKLASRGGARLSDILPDFINKGIYVLDNTYTGTVDWTASSLSWNGLTLSGISECGANMKCDTSPWLGFIPTPNCPPGYAQVATITPIRFAMAQAGIPVGDSSKDEEYRTIGTRNDPRGDYELATGGAGESANDYNKISTTLVVVRDNDPSDPNGGMNYSINGTKQSKPPYWANIYNSPYTFQVNTWLNTTLKAYNHLGKFQGWHGIMGFIYPALQYEKYARAIGAISSGTSVGSNTIIWNLFPVRKEELSAIATIYCYFDRSNFTGNYVDPYMPHKITTMGNFRKTEKPDGPNYNDPNLNYTGVW